MDESNQEDKLYVNTNKQIQIENPCYTNTKYTYMHLKEGRGASIPKKASYAERTLFFIDVRQGSQEHAHCYQIFWASIELQNGCLAIPTQINSNHKGVVMVCTRLVKWLVADIRFSN